MNTKQLCPGHNFVFIDSGDAKAFFSPAYPCPSVAVYRNETKRTDWMGMELFVQMKQYESEDPYRHEFLVDGNTTPSHESVDSRKQLFQFAAFQWDHQHRLFAFAIGIYDSTARFFRFDPSSVAVSQSFSYRDNPKLLAEFFLRYSALSPTERGFDPTVTPATDMERELYRSHLKDYLQRVKEENLRVYPRIQQILNQNMPVFKIQVNDLEGRVHWYLGCSPPIVQFNSAPCGRLTRGYVAVPALLTEASKKGRLYWLKDCWRSDHDESEPTKYQYLKTAGVPNLPELVHGADIIVENELQKTENYLLLQDDKILRAPRSSRPQRMVHHRLVQGLLIPLWYVESARELLRVGRDTLESAHSEFVHPRYPSNLPSL